MLRHEHANPFLCRAQLVVHVDAESLEGLGRWIDSAVLVGVRHSVGDDCRKLHTCLNLLAASDDGDDLGDLPAEALLAVLIDNVGKLTFRHTVDDLSSGQGLLGDRILERHVERLVVLK